MRHKAKRYATKERKGLFHLFTTIYRISEFNAKKSYIINIELIRPTRQHLTSMRHKAKRYATKERNGLFHLYPTIYRISEFNAKKSYIINIELIRPPRQHLTSMRHKAKRYVTKERKGLFHLY